MNHTRTLAAGLEVCTVFLGTLSPLHAEEDLQELSLEQLLNMQVTVASKKAESISEAPAIITVITADEIRTLPSTRLIDLLALAPAMTVSETCNSVNVSVRGISSSNRIVLLLNDVPFREINTGSLFTDLVPLDAIERIEIVRGPGSVMYGTDAFAGIINIITKSKQTVMQVSANGGSKGHLEGTGVLARNYENFSFFTALSDQREAFKLTATDGLGITAQVGSWTRDPDKFNKECFNGYGNVTWGKFSLNVVRFTLLTDALGALPLFRTGGEMDTTGNQISAKYATTVNDININSNIFYNQYDLKELTHNTFPVIPGMDYTVTGTHIIKSHSMGADLYASAPLRDDMTIMAGASYSSENTDPLPYVEAVDGQPYRFNNLMPLIYTKKGQNNPFLSMFLDSHVSISRSVYSQLEYSPVKILKLIAAARLNNNDEYGSNFVPRMAAICSVNDKLTVKALYGSAFRNPTSQEKYASVTGIMLGNEELEPEEINSIELAADWRLSSAVLRLSAFQFVTDKIITLNQATKTYENGEGQTIRGAELEVKGAVQGKGLSYNANVSFKNGTNAENDTDVAFLDTFAGNVMLHHTAGSFHNSLVVKYVGERKGSRFNGNDVTVPALNTTDYKFSHKLTNNLELSLTVMNVFQQGIKYPETTGYMEYIPGESSRNYFVKAAYTF